MKKIRRIFERSILMLLLIVSFGIMFSTGVTALQAITDSIDSGEITAEFVSTGAASGHIADLTVTSNSDSEITLCLENSGLIGMVLANSAAGEQDEVITDTPGTSTGPGATTYTPGESATVSPGGTVTIPIIGYCINYDKSNPAQGTVFSLSSTSGKTDISQIATVLENLTTYVFPVGFTSDNIYNVVQVAMWAAQSENVNVLLEDYATRGYDLDENDVSVVSGFLNTSGIDTTNIVALTGKTKDDTDDGDEDETPAGGGEFPWVYVAAPLIAIAVGAGGYYAYNARKKPTGRGPKGSEPISATDTHVTSYSTPSTDGTAVKACGKSCTANCDLQCEGQCIALCERAVKGWDPNKKRGVPCSKACMGSCTMKCTTSCTADCTSWTQ